MMKSNVLANSVAVVTGVSYILCRLIAIVAPNLLFSIGQSWIHTVNLESVQATTSMSMGTFVLGLVSSVVVAWVAAYAVAQLYNKWEKA